VRPLARSGAVASSHREAPLISGAPQYELYEATGRPAQAQEQFSVLQATKQLLRSNGVRVDLEMALFEADHGSPSAALSAARTEWSRRHSVQVADALA
jgi:hypothetical protein